MLPHVSGRFYGIPGSGTTTSTIALAANTLYQIPFLVPNGGSYDRIGINQSGGGGALYRFGIYGPITGETALAPLILDAGEVNVAGAGDKLATINQLLNAGWYVLALLTNAALTCRMKPIAEITSQLGNSALGGTIPYTSWADAQAYGPMPATLPATPTPGQNNVPYVCLRRT